MNSLRMFTENPSICFIHIRNFEEILAEIPEKILGILKESEKESSREISKVIKEYFYACI